MKIPDWVEQGFKDIVYECRKCGNIIGHAEWDNDKLCEDCELEKEQDEKE